MKKSNWKIFINCGYADELKKVNSLVFTTKKDAQNWARENKYPLKCVVTEDTWNEWMGIKEIHSYGVSNN